MNSICVPRSLLFINFYNDAYSYCKQGNLHVQNWQPRGYFSPPWRLHPRIRGLFCCKSNTTSVQKPTTPHYAASTYVHHVPILDGGCSDSSYRESDIKHLPPPVTSNPPLCITAATGDRIHSVGTTSRSFNDTESRKPPHKYFQGFWFWPCSLSPLTRRFHK